MSSLHICEWSINQINLFLTNLNNFISCTSQTYYNSMFKSTSNVARVFYLFTNQINDTYKTAVSLSDNMLIHVKC